MRSNAHSKGLTLIEVCVIVLVVAVLVAALISAIPSPAVTAKASDMKEKGRSIWVAIVSANSAREALGMTSVWPRVIGFDKSQTSTKYFQTLMSDTNGVPAEKANDRIAFDLYPATLSGCGVPVASSVAQFTKTNNAWGVVCVDDDTPSEAPFLLSRNVDVGSQANARTTPKLTSILPFKQERAVLVTRGGGCFDASPKYLTSDRIFPITNQTYDVMYPQQR